MLSTYFQHVSNNVWYFRAYSVHIIVLFFHYLLKNIYNQYYTIKINNRIFVKVTMKKIKENKKKYIIITKHYKMLELKYSVYVT